MHLLHLKDLFLPLQLFLWMHQLNHPVYPHFQDLPFSAYLRLLPFPVSVRPFQYLLLYRLLSSLHKAEVHRSLPVCYILLLQQPVCSAQMRDCLSHPYIRPAPSPQYLPLPVHCLFFPDHHCLLLTQALQVPVSEDPLLPAGLHSPLQPHHFFHSDLHHFQLIISSHLRLADLPQLLYYKYLRFL